MSEMWIKAIEIILNVYLFWGTLQDIAGKTISFFYIKVGVVIAVINIFGGIYLQTFYGKEWIWSLIPGGIFILTAKLTKEKIGYGDGIVFLILGCCMSASKVWLLWQTALVLSTIYSLVMIAVKKLQLGSKVAYLPFVWMAHFLFLCK